MLENLTRYSTLLLLRAEIHFSNFFKGRKPFPVGYINENGCRKLNEQTWRCPTIQKKPYKLDVESHSLFPTHEEAFAVIERSFLKRDYVKPLIRNDDPAKNELADKTKTFKEIQNIVSSVNPYIKDKMKISRRERRGKKQKEWIVEMIGKDKYGNDYYLKGYFQNKRFQLLSAHRAIYPSFK